MNCDIPLWGAFNGLKKSVIVDFDFGPWLVLVGYAIGPPRGSIFLRIGPFVITQTPLKSNSKNFYEMQLFHLTSPWGCTALAWPPIRPCTSNVSPLWSLVLMGCVIPFQKAFDVTNKPVRADFWLWALTRICGLHHWGLLGGQKLIIAQFFKAKAPCKIKF